MIGIIGGGQLGMMLAEAAEGLGLTARALDPTPGAPASLACEQIEGPYDDAAALDRLAEGAAVITYEFENVPVDAARGVAERSGLPVYPPPLALECGQDRLTEKSLFADLGIDTADF